MPVFTETAEMAAAGCLVKPLFHQWIMDDSVPLRLELLVERPTQRQPDAWFHASQHPLSTDRELWLWLQGRHIPEPMGYISRMSVMFGSLSHAATEAFLDYIGVAVPLPPGDCPACGRPRRPPRARSNPSKYCTEHGFVNLDTRSRCHLDSILRFGDDLYGFDLKTIRPFAFKGSKTKPPIRDMDAEQFREVWPHYWAQMQECMRLSGLRRYIVFFMGLGNPWELREFHLDFDPEFAAETEAKYRRVISCADRGLEILV